MDIQISLNDEDLNHFRRAMEQARQRNSGLSAAEICAHAAALLEKVRSRRVPDFVSDRMRHLVSLIAMVQDQAWNLEDEDKTRVLAALSYFSEPHDDIPDSVPVFGFLDDAIMIELVMRELRHELEAYDEFCVYRATDGGGTGLTRDEWLAQRREELMDRMRRRRSSLGSSYAGTRPFSLFTAGG
ncbi:MAG: DUF1232 domain-containing protein [Xanthomonadales bacterium]|nr:DUF1232 domain-containing protein [Xanthomonadales bacterium]